MRKILPGTLEVGKPLVDDYYDAAGTLLLRRGNVLQNSKQLEALIERGLYEKHEEVPTRAPTPAAQVASLTNPFDLLKRCKARLTPLLNHFRFDDPEQVVDPDNLIALKAEYWEKTAERCAAPEAKDVMPDGFPQRITEIARVIQKVCRLDADAALGYVHLGGDERYTIVHPLHCAILAEVLGAAIGLAVEQRLPIIAATLTANIAILNFQERLHKQQGELSQAQRHVLGVHGMLAGEMLREMGVADETWLNAVLAHHERVDGGGYPARLMGDAIPLGARIVALADIYDAMIKPRGHRKPLGSREALREIFLKRGNKVDDALAKALIKELGVYPPGSFVRLRNGETAIAFRRGETATAPLVRSLIGPRGAPLEFPIRRNTAETHYVVVDSAPRDASVVIDLNVIWDYETK